MATTRLGISGLPARPYGDFSLKSGKAYTGPVTRLGLSGLPGRPYGSFAGKEPGGTVDGLTSATALSSPAGTYIGPAVVAGMTSATALSTPAGEFQSGEMAKSIPASDIPHWYADPGFAATYYPWQYGTPVAARGNGAMDGTVAAASTATALSTPAGTQTHVGAVSAAASTTALSTMAGVSATAGTVANAASAANLSTPAGVQTHAGAVANAASATALSAPGADLTGAVASATSATSLSSPTAGGAVAGATSATSLSSPAGVQTHIGVVASMVSLTTASSAAEPPPPPWPAVLGSGKGKARVWSPGIDDDTIDVVTEDEGEEVIDLVVALVLSGVLTCH